MSLLEPENYSEVSDMLGIDISALGVFFWLSLLTAAFLENLLTGHFYVSPWSFILFWDIIDFIFLNTILNGNICAEATCYGSGNWVLMGICVSNAITKSLTWS